MEQKGGYINNTLIELVESNPKLDELRKSITKLRNGDKEDYRVYLDSYMSLGVFNDHMQKLGITNYLLVNKQDYILIDERNDTSNPTTFILNDDYSIKEYTVKELIPDFYSKNTNILGLTSDIIYSNILFSDRVFLKLSKSLYLRKNNFPYYNKLLNILYNDGKYNRNMNPILSFIFMNKFHELLDIINNVRNTLVNDDTNYYATSNVDNKKLKIDLFNDFKSSYICDVLLIYANLSDKNATINTIDEINNNLKYILQKRQSEPIILFLKEKHSKLSKEQKQEITDEYLKLDLSQDYIKYNFGQKHVLYDFIEIDSYIAKVNESIKPLDSTEDNYNLLLKIINIVIQYVNRNENLINGYNYSIYIQYYKNLTRDPIKNKDESEDNYNKRKEGEYVKRRKDMEKFINEKDVNKIKQKLIFELSYYIYLSYKINEESGDFNIKLAQNTLMDYFLGVTNDEIPNVPINPRQTLVNIRGGPDDNKSYVIPNKQEEQEEQGEQEEQVEQVEQVSPIIDQELSIDNIYYNHFLKQSHNIPLPINEMIRDQSHIYQDNERGKYDYPDCGERTLLNFFNYILIQKNRSFDISKLHEIKIIKFYQKYQTIDDILKAKDRELKSDWGLVIENHQQLISKNMYNNRTFNFKPSVENFTFICNLFCKKVGSSLSDIIKYLNPKITNEKIKQYKEPPYDVFIINDELKLLLNIGHSESHGISKFNNTYEILQTKLGTKLLINHPYTDINIHLIIKIINGNFDEKQCGNYEVMKYLINKYFIFDSVRLYNQSKYNLLKYMVYENINIVDDHLDITDNTILEFIFNQITIKDNIEHIIEFITESFTYLSQNLISKFLDIDGPNFLKYSNLERHLKKYPLNLIKRIYDYKINKKRFVEFINSDSDEIDDTRSYVIIYYNNKLTENNSKIKKIITKCIEILEQTEEYRDRIRDRNSQVRDIYNINTYDSDLDFEYGEHNRNSILKIISDFKGTNENKLIMRESLYQLYELTDNNSKIKTTISSIKSTLQYLISPMYPYINDKLIEKRRLANIAKLAKMREYKLTAPTRALTHKTKAESIISLINTKFIELNVLIQEAKTVNTEINSGTNQKLKDQSSNAISEIDRINSNVNTNVTHMRELLEQINILYTKIVETAITDENLDEKDQQVKSINVSLSKIEAIDIYTNDLISNIKTQVEIAQKRELVQKPLWDYDFDYSSFEGGYYNKSKKYYNKLYYRA
jgi:hypothetical protein